MQSLKIGERRGAELISNRFFGRVWRQLPDKPETMSTPARCGYLLKCPILSPSFPTQQEFHRVMAHVGIDQLGAVLTKPDPVVGVRALLRSQIGVEPRPTCRRSGYVRGNPKIQLAIARGVRPER